MNLRQRNKANNLTKTLKDYAIPIAVLFLVIILFFNLFSGSNSKNIDKSLENSSGVKIVFDSATTEAFIEYYSGKKTNIESDTNLYKGEKLTVKEGSVNIKSGDMNLSLDKMGILEYKSDGTLFLDSANMWVNTKVKSDFAMKFINISSGANSVFNLYQNEVESSIYVLSGTVEIANLAEQSIILSSGEKLSLLSTDASKTDIDLSSMKAEFDEYFKTSDWFIKNSGAKYLKTKEVSSSTGKTDETSTGSTSKTKLSGLISFDDLTDESLNSSSSIDIAGVYNTMKVSKITLNGISAKLNSQEKTFIFSSIALAKKTNDLIFRIYDENDELLDKITYTIYSDKASETISSDSNTTQTNSFKNSDIDVSKFVFTAPSSSPVYTTYETQVTIKGATPAGVVSKVSVNDFTLGSFNGTTWRYHAFIDQGTMKNGTNLYEIKYFDASGNMIYKNQFTIIKKSQETNTESSAVSN